MKSRFVAHLQRAIGLNTLDRDRPTGTGKPASVLVLFGNVDQEPSILLTRRTDLVETHKGQIAFPGGVCDPEDFLHQGRITTAIRETHEEMGIDSRCIEIHGVLPDIWTVTGFLVTPVVATLSVAIEDLEVTPNPSEIAGHFWVTLRKLQAQETYSVEHREYLGKTYPVHVFQVDENRVWGATASILKDLLDRLELSRLQDER